MRALLPCLLLTFAAPAWTQALVFEPGYILRDGDRIDGYVRLGTEADNAISVRHRTSLDGEVVEYRAGEIEEYGTDTGLRYRAGRYRVQAPGFEDATMPTVREGFARVVRVGTTDLLAFEVRDRTAVFFVEVAGGEPVGLYRAVTAGGAARTAVERPLYRQALLVALGECAGDPALFAALSYTEEALAARVDAANACADPDYVVAHPAAVSRRSIFDGVEVGGGMTTGRFERVIEPRTTTDPMARAPFVNAGVVIKAASFDWLRFVVQGTYTPGAVDIGVFMGTGYRTRRVSTAHLGLGVRALTQVGRVDVEAGIGVLGGTNVQRVTADRVDYADPDAAVIWNVRRDDFTSSGGQYAEVGVRPPSFPVTITARLQRTLYSNGRMYLPGVQDYHYKHESVVFGARWRFGS